jgi:formyltetrahydrofolate synthetase
MLIVCMLLTGKLPYAVSPDSITASVPSRTAIEMSETSARVGAGLLIMDSNMLVATMTGLPRLRHPCKHRSQLIKKGAWQVFSTSVTICKTKRVVAHSLAGCLHKVLKHQSLASL